MNVERGGVGDTHTDPIGEMTKLTCTDDSKVTRHDKTMYSIEGGEKIPSDMLDYCTTCTELRNFQVYRDCLAGLEEPAQPSEAGMSDITAALTGMRATALGALFVTP